MSEALRLFDPAMLDRSPDTSAGQLSIWATPQASKALRRASVPILEQLLRMCRFESEAATVSAELERKRARSRSAAAMGA
jgi:hypothetical protein